MGGFEDIAQDRGFDRSPFRRRELVVEPVVGESNGDGDFAAIKKRANNCSLLPARGGDKSGERFASCGQRRFRYGALGS